MNLHHRAAVAATLAVALLGGCATSPMSMPDPPARMKGGMLVGPNGMTLYAFDGDPAGGARSVCNGPCANSWPPLMARAGDRAMGDFDVITRDDGSQQWTFRGKPLYYRSGDSQAGDTTGDGAANSWHVVR